MKDGTIIIDAIDPAELAPDEFVHRVRATVEKRHAKLVIIDSINGYFLAMPGDRFTRRTFVRIR